MLPLNKSKLIIRRPRPQARTSLRVSFFTLKVYRAGRDRSSHAVPLHKFRTDLSNFSRQPYGFGKKSMTMDDESAELEESQPQHNVHQSVATETCRLRSTCQVTAPRHHTHAITTMNIFQIHYEEL